MAIVATNLETTGSAADATSYTTGSVAPSANAVVLLGVFSARSSGVKSPTPSGLGLTWVLEAAFDYVAGTRRLSLWSALTGGSAPTPGTILLDFGATTMTGCAWTIIDVTGINTTDAVLQPTTNSGTATSGSITLAAFGSASNATFAFWAHGADEVTAPEVGWTELGDYNNSLPSIGFESEWLNANDTSPTASWATSAVWGGIALELAAAAAAGTHPGWNRGWW